MNPFAIAKLSPKQNRSHGGNNMLLADHKAKFLAFLILVLVFALVACDTSSPTPADFNFSLGSSLITLTQATTDSVSISISRQNHTGEIVFSISGIPAGVTPTFDPLATTGDASTLEFEVAASVAAGSYSLLVKAESGGVQKEKNLTLKVQAPATVTVTGKIIDAFMQPLAGLPVKINGVSDVSEADGSFSIAGVSAPYDVIIINNPTNTGFIFQGLSRVDPTLQLFDLSSAPSFSAQVSGNLAGGAGFPNPASHQAIIAFGSEDGSGRLRLAPASGPAYGPMSVNWSGTTTTNGSLHALQWKVNASGLPTDYTGYAKKAFSLSDGGVFGSPATDLNLSNVSELNISGTVSLPSGYSSQGRVMYVDWGKNTTSLLAMEPSLTPNFTYATPNLPDTTMTLLNLACGVGGCAGLNNSSWVYKTGLSVSASNVGLANFKIPSPSLPVDVAVGIDADTEFSWEAMDNSVHMVMFQGGGANPDYVVVTTKNTTKLPDLSAEGLGLPSGANYSWMVLGFNPFATMDVATTPTGFVSEFFNAYFGLFVDGRGPERDGAFSISKERSFTTAP
jgi:hypothetical protein